MIPYQTVGSVFRVTAIPFFTLCFVCGAGERSVEVCVVRGVLYVVRVVVCAPPFCVCCDVCGGVWCAYVACFVCVVCVCVCVLCGAYGAYGACDVWCVRACVCLWIRMDPYRFLRIP